MRMIYGITAHLRAPMCKYALPARFSGAGRRGAPAQTHHDQRRGAGPDEEPLDAAVAHHEPKEPRRLAIAGNNGQRGLQHQLHGPVGQPGQDGDPRGRELPRPDMNEDLSLGFRRHEVEELDGGDEVDGHARLLAPHQRALGVRKGF